ncbi:MAG TPA: phosphoribosyl-AMP cyclohydrolase [bacterium]|nr:phosphoribosyl-AMP cyclohydrolase [bacterium]
MSIDELKFNEAGLIPCIVQDEESKDILMMAWMNKESIKKTLESGTTWFWSRSRQEFWNKGATSGNMQMLKKLLYDCDGDTLVAIVKQQGSGACHTGNWSCFYRELKG